MSSSYEKINYALRPAKNIERKMLAEAFRRLSVFYPIEQYRYVGLGSTFFSDFSLFHRVLGIESMISIEEDRNKKDRFVFNRPYSCIEIYFGMSSAVLPDISWEAPTILWMDYDSKPKEEMFIALAHFFRHAVHGSVSVFSINVHGLILEDLKAALGDERIPASIVPTQLNDWGGAKLLRDILTNEIADRLNERNGTLAAQERLVFKQLFNFHYQDGARMLTFGGVVCQPGKIELVERCLFGSLPFVREGDEAYEIEVPVLTLGEIRGLDAELPGGDLTKFAALGIPQEDLEKYKRIYRYFPRFSEAEI